MAPFVEASLAPQITFASHQCAVAVIGEIIVHNPTVDGIEDLVVELVCDPPILAPKTWVIDRIGPKSETRVRDRNVSIDGGTLSRLSERVRATVTIRLRQGDAVLHVSQLELTALARNEWGGAASMPELLAAFVMPNDPATSEILRDAGEVLRRSGKQPALNGYQSRSRERVWELTSAIWSAVSARRLIYAEPPASFETAGQKIRMPSDVLGQGLATCLDTAVLFAAACEQAGLNPIIAFTKGHALAGVWLQPVTLPGLTTDDAGDLRTYSALKELVMFETTLVCNEPPVSFSQAIDAGTRLIGEEVEGEFVYAIDLRQARARQIAPLAVELKIMEGEQSEGPRVALGLEEAPVLPAFDFGMFEGEKPDTPEGRLEHWKRKLLDLTKRNRLLNLKPSKTAIRMVCPDPALLEDKLADEIKISIIPMESLGVAAGQRSDDVFSAQTGRDFKKEFAAKALDRDQLPADVPEQELRAGLVELYRKASSDLQEGGANTLFLAMGMLRWRVNEKDSQSYRAPLILLPVKLERASAASNPRLSRHGDDPVFNMTLLQMLRQDFELRIPELEGPLPEDDRGVDVTRIWTIMRQAIRDVPGFEVTEEIVLSTFSFAKYLMWKDLSDRTDELRQASFVAHMIDKPRESYGRAPAFLDECELDGRIDPSTLFTPLPADSSQVVAIHAAGSDGDFVLEGPPGTGKSQTIANIIAHNLGLGRRVLFVAEKMTALNVVYERLKAEGLGDFCLELHSSKANKKAVIDQLDASWRNRGTKAATEWEAEAAKLKGARDKLNGLVEALHRPGLSGVSPRAAVATACASRFAPTVMLDWANMLSADRAGSRMALDALRDQARLLGQAFALLEPADFEAFDEINQTEWSYAWSTDISAAASELMAAGITAKTAATAFAEALKLPSPSETLSSIEALAQFAATIPLGAEHDLSAVLGPDGKAVTGRLECAAEALVAYRKHLPQLSVQYSHDAIAKVEAEALDATWRAVKQRIWPLNVLGAWRIAGKTRTALDLAAKPDLENDIPLLRELTARLAIMLSETTALPVSAGWRGVETDTDRMKKLTATARAIGAATASLADDPAVLNQIRQSVRLLLVDGHDMIQAGLPIARSAETLVDAAKRQRIAVDRFASLGSLDEAACEDLAKLRQIAEAIVTKTPRLNAWCRWQLQRETCESAGLGVIAAALEVGSVSGAETPQAFDVAYCRWLAPLLIDERPELKAFSAVEHEHLIHEFRALDQRLAKLSAGYIRARLSSDVPKAQEESTTPGFATLRREAQKQRAHKAVRQLIDEMGPALTRLTPCLLMSPLSVAQYLAAGREPFDLVIFDEASQIAVWDAIGAIARGRNVIIVGDPKQMPPTNFFNRSPESDDDEGGSETATVEDLQSILEEGLAANMKHHRLTGHYRSRHESLIAFSNHRYYASELVTYPSAETRESAVSFVRCQGVYQKGKERTNPIEAKAVVAEIVRRLRDPKLKKLTIGVVTMNAEQQRLIRNLLDEERRARPELEENFRDNDGGEIETVYNLETVQGHERDVILLSVGYGPAALGAPTMSMNFGPLNQKGGQRRLNVAITRATSEVMIFASFDPDMIDTTRTKAEAIADLKGYLEFAKFGHSALAKAVSINGGTDEFDSAFEEAVAHALRTKGWQVQTQVGVSKFRIDLGIVHPDAPGRFLAGVECDGAAYHSSPTARDRDRVRHAILEQLGWSLVRLWSTDFFLDAARAIDVVHNRLSALLEADRVKFAGQHAEKANVPYRAAPGESSTVDSDNDPASSAEVETTPPLVDSPSVDTGSPTPLFTSPALAGVSASSFYEDAYRPVLQNLCLDLIDHFGPITFGYLAAKIARAHGFQRTGSEIKKTVLAAIGKRRPASRTADDETVFWPEGSKPQIHTVYRGREVMGDPRGWSDTPYPEKLGLAVATLRTLSVDAAPAAMALQIGLGRLRNTTKQEMMGLLKVAENLFDEISLPH
jgi:very-short-patch-repair endonuclease